MTDMDSSGTSSSGLDVASGEEGAVGGQVFCETDSIFSRLPPEVFGELYFCNLKQKQPMSIMRFMKFR